MNGSSRGFRGIAIAVLVVLLVGVGLYFVGRWQERSRAEAQRVEFERQQQATEAQLSRAREQLAAAENRARLLRVRGTLFEAALELDRRNFGIANRHLQSAGQTLGSVTSGFTGVDAQKLEDLRGAIAEANVNVATNLQAQRTRVLDFAARLDELISSTQNGVTADG